MKWFNPPKLFKSSTTLVNKCIPFKFDILLLSSSAELFLLNIASKLFIESFRIISGEFW